MSVFHLPRLHFAGTATTQLPTGPRTGLLDLATNQVLGSDGTRYSPRRPALEYDGPRGNHFGGNGHFAIDAVVSAVELRAGEANTADPVVGHQVDMWGHYNEYLQTTVNRARVFDIDPSSNWTTTVMVGRFGFGRAGRSHDDGYVLTGDVSGFQPPRWHDFAHGGSAVHQFAVESADLTWLKAAESSPAVTELATALASADGLVVQFALIAPDTPQVPDAPRRWELRGTIAPRYEEDSRTCPGGRLMLPVDRGRAPHVFSVGLTARHVMFNMITAAGPWLPAGNLELRTARTGTLVADVSRESCLDGRRTGGLVCVPRMSAEGDNEELVLASATDGRVLSREQNVCIQVDDACRILEHPRHPEDADHDVEVVFRSFVHGRPAAVDAVRLRQFPNPRALPLAADAEHAEILRMDREVLSTDANGVGRFRLRGLRAGSTRILLSADDHAPAQLTYDNDDKLGFWAGAGGLCVRVLPDDWRLADIPEDEVTYDLLYEEIFAPYELQYSFMRDEVFSLADRCKVETYAKLIWQMCDPRNRSKTYYMPPTRDLTAPKAQLLLKYLRQQQRPDVVLRSERESSPQGRGITTRTEMASALRDAVTLELAVMLQYLYAAYSVPTHGAGCEYVRAGDWTEDQLRLACGDGGETLDGGIRGTLIRVAREEMIHFLLANNILTAIGESFYFPNVDFGAVNALLPIPLDLSLERLNLASALRFVHIEQPDDRTREVRLGERAGKGGEDQHTYSSIAELYGAIREGLRTVPGLFAVERGRGGGEHHLFLRESIDRRHPDYQLEVDDLASALFAVDVITEQGEGGDLTDGAEPAEESHYEAFRGVVRILRETEWIPSYPTVRNPTVHRGDKAREYVPDPEAREVMRLFNNAYSVMIRLMVQQFGGRPDASLRRSRLMNAAIDVMTGILRPLGELLVTMPSGLRGRTAGPSFELATTPVFVSRHDVAMRGIARELEELAVEAAKCELVPGRVPEISVLLAETVRNS